MSLIYKMSDIFFGELGGAVCGGWCEVSRNKSVTEFAMGGEGCVLHRAYPFSDLGGLRPVVSGRLDAQARAFVWHDFLCG